MKKHFWKNRIKLLSIGLSLVVICFVAAGAMQAEGTLKEKAGTATMATVFALTPFALIGKLKTAGKWDDLDEGTKTYVQGLEEELNRTFKEVQTGILDEAAIKGKHEEWMKKYGEGLTPEQKSQVITLHSSLKTLAEQVQKLEDKGLGAGNGDSDLMTQLKASKEKIIEFKNSGRKGMLKFEINKAGGADQAASDIATHTIGTRVPGIGQIPTRKPFMRDLFTWIPCNLEYIKYIDQETVVRDAQNVASAAASTHTSKVTWKERSIQITAVRDLIDVPIDMLDDYDFVEGELKRLLDVNVALKIDNGLLKDNGVYPNLHSVDEVASEFDATNTLGGTITPWTNSVQNANIFDLVIAMASQIISLGQDGSFMPNVVLFNTIDRYKALLIKDKDDNYMMPPFVVRNGNKDYTIDGMIVRSNPNVPANSLRVFDSTKATGYQRKAAVAEISYENATNFETEVATLKVYERLNMLIRNVDKNAFMKCTDITAALTALSTP